MAQSEHGMAQVSTGNHGAGDGPPTLTPHTAKEAAAMLARAAVEGRAVRIRGGATKLAWGGLATLTPDRTWSWLDTAQLDRVTINDNGTTATLAGGTGLARAQSILARSGMMLAVDPQLGLGRSPAATIGGVIACADCGPLSHRYGSISDQLEGVTLATADGSQLHSGRLARADTGGYDLARLACGSFGTLGLILAVEVRLQPLPKTTASATGTAEDASLLEHAAATVAARHPELQALDIAWRDGRGALLVQAAGELAASTAGNVATTMRELGVTQVGVVGQDEMLWARQRAAQRSLTHAVLRVLTPPSRLPAILALADTAGATVVGRAARGVYYMTLDPTQITTVRRGLPPGSSAMLLDLPTTAGPLAGHPTDRYGVGRGHALETARRLKARFDPLGVCNPGVFIGGI